MKKIYLVVGTRPEAIKLFPLYRAIKSDGCFEVRLVLTGQHREDMIEPLLDFFKVEPDFRLGIMRPGQSLAEFASLLLNSLDKLFDSDSPDLVVVQGDTTSCMVASLSAFYRGIKIAHVEAGLRTYDRCSPFPEEVNRRITSLVANFHFTPTELSQQNLLNENVEGRVVVTGNTVIDSLLYAVDKINKDDTKYKARFKPIFDRYEKVILVTGHRRENMGANFTEIYKAIKLLARKYKKYAFIYPMHVNPNVRLLLLEELNGIDNILLIEPLPYDEMVFIIMKSYIVMTDSGGLQEECPSLNVPVIVFRQNTERPEGVKAGCCILAGTKKDDVFAAFERLVSDEKHYKETSSVNNPYGDGNSSRYILEYLKSNL